MSGWNAYASFALREHTAKHMTGAPQYPFVTTFISHFSPLTHPSRFFVGLEAFCIEPESDRSL